MIERWGLGGNVGHLVVTPFGAGHKISPLLPWLNTQLRRQQQFTCRVAPGLLHRRMPLFRFLLFTHREYDAETRFATQHAIIGGLGLYERKGLDHGANACERAEVERVFRIPGGS